MKLKIKSTVAAVVALAALTLTSCGKNAWESDLEKAKAKASKQGKEIYLLFSGDDWNDESKAFKASVSNTESFNTNFKDYILVNIDFSQDRYAKSMVGESASKKELKEAKIIEAEYKVKNSLAQKYGIQAFPMAFILNEEGLVILDLPFNPEQTNADSYKAAIDERAEEAAAAKDLINAVKMSSGLEKVSAINNLCEKTNGAYIGTLDKYVEMVPSLDPENQSGLVGEYLVKAAYFKTAEAVQNGEDPAGPFVEVAENPMLSTELKQEAYYIAAYNLAMTGSQEFDRMLEYLQKSYDIDPDGEHSGDLLSAMEGVKQMKVMAEQYMQQMQMEAEAAMNEGVQAE